MHYELWISSADGSNRLDLVPDSDDADAVADLAAALIRVVSGPLQIGVTLSSEDAGTRAATPHGKVTRPGTHERK